MKSHCFILAAAMICGLSIHSYSQENEDIAHEYVHTKVMITDPQIAFILENQLKETSGLIFYRDAIWTHNDSGNDPVIYKVDTAMGIIRQKVTLEGAKNIDWEDITQDETFIYAGDFGNNRGSRKDLKIYKVLKDRIPENGDVSVKPEVIDFYFSDQVSFEEQNRSNDYDCESIISLNGGLYLFSKNWISGKTRLYRLPSDPGAHEAQLIGEFSADGLVTGAAINPIGNRIALIGYKNFTPFIWLFRNFEGNDFFGGKAVRVDLPHLMGSQTEGITFTDSVNLLISCEKMATDPQVYETSTMKWENGPKDELKLSDVSNWEYTVIEKKRKNIRLLAIDLSALRNHTFELWVETVMNPKPVPFYQYQYERHMGKVYLEIDVYPFPTGKYNVVAGTGNVKYEKELVLTKF